MNLRVTKRRFIGSVSNPLVKTLSKFEEEIGDVEESTGLGLDPR